MSGVIMHCDVTVKNVIRINKETGNIKALTDGYTVNYNFWNILGVVLGNGNKNSECLYSQNNSDLNKRNARGNAISVDVHNTYIMCYFMQFS